MVIRFDGRMMLWRGRYRYTIYIITMPVMMNYSFDLAACKCFLLFFPLSALHLLSFGNVFSFFLNITRSLQLLFHCCGNARFVDNSGLWALPALIIRLTPSARYIMPNFHPCAVLDIIDRHLSSSSSFLFSQIMDGIQCDGTQKKCNWNPNPKE